MTSLAPMLLSQRVAQVCLFLVGAIAIFGGSLQMYLGQPETAPRLDNVHRFMGGIYLMSGVMGLWAASTIREHNTLVFLMAATVFVGGLGRALSISEGRPARTACTVDRLSRAGAGDPVDHHRGAGDDEQADGGRGGGEGRRVGYPLGTGKYALYAFFDVGPSLGSDQ